MSQYTLNPPFRNNLVHGAQGNTRMYVRPNVYLPNGEIDFQSGMVREAERRTGRTQALRREASQLDSEYARLQAQLQARVNEKGRRMPMRTAVILIAAFIVLFSIVLLVQQGNIIAKENSIEQINENIKATQAVVSDIQAQIDEASDPVQICYTAARDLDMIPGESAEAIYLTALNTRPNQEPIAIRAGTN